MGVQYATIHLLKGLPQRECNLGSRTSVANNHVILENSRGNKSGGPETRKVEGWMDVPVEGCSREYLRRTMIDQQKVFHEQVLELHRLYRIQRALMSELNKEHGSRPAATAAVSSGMVGSDARSGLWSSTSDSRTSRSSEFVDRAGDSIQTGPCHRRNMVNGGIALACATVPHRTRPVYEDHSGVAEEMENNDLDLTLRIGSASSAVKEARKVEPAGSTSDDAGPAMAITLNHGMPWIKKEQWQFHSPGPAGLQCPPWLPQALGLNRT